MLDNIPEPDEDVVTAVRDRLVVVRAAEGLEFSSEVDAALEGIALDVARGLARALPPASLLARSNTTDIVTITYLGEAQFSSPESTNSEEKAVEPTPEAELLAGIPPEMLDGALWMDGVETESGIEFRMRVPLELAAQVDTFVHENGLADGKNNTDPNAEPIPLGLSNGIDIRVMKGTLNTAHTNTNFRRIVQVNGSTTSGCSAVLVGPKHTLTAGHCVWSWTGANTGSWTTGTLRAGRNGTAWRADASISSNRYYWVPSQFRASSTSPVAGVYDIGMFVTHGGRMGDDPDVDGWFGWRWTTSTSTFEGYEKVNRGYPACGLSNPPDGDDCNQNHLYGQNPDCTVGGYSSTVDPWGIPLRFKHSCDTSAAMSGSPLYGYDNAWVVVGIHTGWDTTTGPEPNIATRVTREYSSNISWFRNTYP